MKIAKSQLKRIIKEELESVLSEQTYDVRAPSPRELVAAYSEEEEEKPEDGSYWEATAMQNVSKGDAVASDRHNIKKVAEQMAAEHGWPSKRMRYVDLETKEKKVQEPRAIVDWYHFKERAIYYIMYTGSLEFDSTLEKKYLLTRKDYPEIGVVRKKSLPRLSKHVKPFSVQEPKDTRTHQQRLHQQYLKRKEE